jgi:3'-5' exoribonuclease
MKPKLAKVSPSTQKVLDYLHQQVQHLSLPLQKACLEVLNDPRFQTYPASTRKHHVYKGGLAIHTAEALQIALTTATYKRLDTAVITVAVIFHDYGKCWDYQKSRNGRYVKTEHAAHVHHVSRSHSELRRILGSSVKDELLDHIAHCILSHHGRKEYGSPVEPQTQEAWAVHLADMTSVHCIEARKNA